MIPVVDDAIGEDRILADLRDVPLPDLPAEIADIDDVREAIEIGVEDRGLARERIDHLRIVDLVILDPVENDARGEIDQRFAGKTIDVLEWMYRIQIG